MKRIFVFLLLLFLTVVFCSFSYSFVCASDLDDGISKYTDDPISKWDELGKPQKNIKYIKLRAKAKAETMKGNKNYSKIAKGNQANMNSVVLGAGSTIKGDIIIIDESRGPKTQVVGR